MREEPQQPAARETCGAVGEDSSRDRPHAISPFPPAATAVAMDSLSKATATNVTAVIWDARGNHLAMETIRLAADRHAALPLTGLAPEVAGNRGIIRFTRGSGTSVGGPGLRVSAAGAYRRFRIRDALLRATSSSWQFRRRPPVRWSHRFSLRTSWEGRCHPCRRTSQALRRASPRCRRRSPK